MYGPNNLMIDMLDIVKIVQRLRAQRLELRATLVATAALAQSKCDKRRTGVHDIDVETGSMRADVCEQLDVRSFCEVMELIDDSGATHDPETFYTDYEA